MNYSLIANGGIVQRAEPLLLGLEGAEREFVITLEAVAALNGISVERIEHALYQLQQANKFAAMEPSWMSPRVWQRFSCGPSRSPEVEAQIT